RVSLRRSRRLLHDPRVHRVRRRVTREPGSQTEPGSGLRCGAPTSVALRNSRTRFKDRTWFGSVKPRWHPRDAPRRPSVEPGSRVSNPGSAVRDHFLVREFLGNTEAAEQRAVFLRPISDTAACELGRAVSDTG